ncbi:hypothetical protein Ancab_008365 [Ancistrocladus abbreviatus]
MREVKHELEGIRRSSMPHLWSFYGPDALQNQEEREHLLHIALEENGGYSNSHTANMYQSLNIERLPSDGSLPSGTMVRVIPQGSRSPASPHKASLPHCLSQDAGCEGSTPLVSKRSKRKQGAIVRRGKLSRRPWRKMSFPGSKLGCGNFRRQLSGVSIRDSSIRNRNRVLLLQQELTIEGVWEVGKWLGAAYAGDKAEVLAHIRALEVRDKARGDKQ